MLSRLMESKASIVLFKFLQSINMKKKIKKKRNKMLGRDRPNHFRPILAHPFMGLCSAQSVRPGPTHLFYNILI